MKKQAVEIFSVRTFLCIWFEADEAITKTLTLNDIFHDDDYEFKYALQMWMDDLLDLHVGHTCRMQFNRDDQSAQGIVKRIK